MFEAGLNLRFAESGTKNNFLTGLAFSTILIQLYSDIHHNLCLGIIKSFLGNARIESEMLGEKQGEMEIDI